MIGGTAAGTRSGGTRSGGTRSPRLGGIDRLMMAILMVVDYVVKIPGIYW